MRSLLVSTCLAGALFGGAAMAQTQITPTDTAPKAQQNGGQTVPGAANTQPGVQPQGQSGDASLSAGQQSSVGSVNPTPGSTATPSDTTGSTPSEVRYAMS